MTENIKRLRVFAGPNGSGKSTLYDYLTQIDAFHSYYHINPDIIEKDLTSSLNLENWPINFNYTELKDFLKVSPFQSKATCDLSELLVYHEHGLSLKDASLHDNGYLAAAIADFLRKKMFHSNSSFSFESVFSHVSKIKELEKAKKANYKIYLYFITTSDPQINLQRVKNRVESGGHDVSDDKINSRYPRTMKNLYDAFMLADRAYLFDNSKEKAEGLFNFFAEKDGKYLRLANLDQIPQWFEKFILRKL
jgi:predicted ABC-type ATPase